MSGQQPPANQPPYLGGPRGWNPRPNSPWSAPAPSPPPLASGARRPSLPSPVAMGSPTLFGPPMSPGGSNLRGTRGSTNMPHPRPQWPQPLSPLAAKQLQSPYPGPAFQQQSSQMCPSSPVQASGAGVNGPKPFRPLHVQQQRSYGDGGPTSSFQLSPTPSPIVCQTPVHDFMYGSNRLTTHNYETLPQQHYTRQQSLSSMSASPSTYHRPPQYEFVGVPLEPPQPKSYVIYDDDDDYGPTTAEIIANQSQDYIDEKLAEYQMTILQLQEKSKQIFTEQTLTKSFESFKLSTDAKDDLEIPVGLAGDKIIFTNFDDWEDCNKNQRIVFRG
uniref:Uncharacterized protein n=1 Tax=Glossina palpalis gambiensis TaxID=67801 RepID=A0A1B0BZJ9_9MUSC